MTSDTVSRHRSDGRTPEARRRIRARKEVPLPPELLYAFLARLDNHWLLTDRFVSLVRLHGPEQSRTGGEITIRGPWGLHRHARTWLDADAHALRLVGTAAVGRKTIARVTWTLRPIPGGTDVELAASVLAASLPDRALLVVAAPWLRRRFLAAIVRLEEQAASAAPSVVPSGAVEGGQEPPLGAAVAGERLGGDPHLLDDPAADSEHASADASRRHVPAVGADADDLAQAQPLGHGT
jgi:hypothetical protein